MPERFHISDCIKISVSLENDESGLTTSPELQVAQTCFHITRSLFLVIAAANGYGEGFTQNSRADDAEAFYEVAMLGVVFTDTAFNALDEHGLRTFRENSGGEKDA